MRWLYPLLVSLRPRQWTKNLLLYLAFLFTIDERWGLDHLDVALGLLARVSLGFVAFCALASATYLVNDLVDAPRDRRHPRKRLRPIASGALSAPLALASALALAGGGLALSFAISRAFGLVALAYMGVSLSYSLYLKRVVLVDVLALSAGYLVRAIAGAVAIAVPISPWLYVCTTLATLLIGLGKRRNELVLAGAQGDASAQREALAEYSPRLLDQLIAVVTPSALMAYILYTFTAPNLPANHAMMLTIPFVLYGLFRYLYLVHHRNLGETPEDILFQDRPLAVTIALWLASAVAVLVAFR